MLIRPGQENLGSDTPNLDFVVGELVRNFRLPRGGFVAVNPEDKRHAQHAMCAVCPWTREFEDTRKASDAALAHGRMAHGDMFLGFVRIETR